MTKQALVLPMTEAELRLEMRHRGWWDATVVGDSRTVVLGSDLILPIVDGLLTRLSVAGHRAGERDGRHVHWLISLWGEHHSVYCAFDGGERLLYFQDVRGELVWRDRLSPAHLKRWLTALRGARAAIRP